MDQQKPKRPTRATVKDYGDNVLSEDSDERELARVGKKSVLRRNFAFLGTLGFACCLMITWEGMCSVFIFGLMDGGPAGLIYGFLFCWIGYGTVVATMGELVSMWPTAGGQYHWTHRLSPDELKNVLSYITGWQSVIAWQALAAAGGYLTATSLQGLIINSQSDYDPTRWQGTLLVFAVIFFCFLFNTWLANGTRVAYRFGAAKSSSEDVWALFSNEGGYNKGVSFFVGLVTPVFAFTGADGAVHMCEEIKHASTVLPKALLGSIFINGILGFAMLIAILYCIGDIDAALNSVTGYPFIEIFTQGTSSIVGGTTLSAFLVTMFTFATIGCVASASRQLWAFARDNAVPNAKLISYVHPSLKIPLVSIFITCLISCLLSLINIGSATVFNAVVSLTVAGFFGSYLLPFCLLLNTRIRHPERLEFGPWKLGRFGPWINGIAIAWSALVMFFSFWPTSVPVTPVNMNWSCVLWGAVVIFAGVFWVLHGRYVYKGPVIETDVV